MKFALSLAACLALAVGLSLSFVHPADAWFCGWRCRMPVVVTPAPVVVTPAPVVVPAPVITVPAAHPIPLRGPCGAGCGRGVVYGAGFYYGPYPLYAGSCYAGGCGGYWRRDCWYDAYGRRWCN